MVIARYTRHTGFTIVELLIVIVVIAILAAISIVAYNGIQTRAENNKTIAAVNQALKLLMMYKETTGTYPTTNNSACFGTGYTAGACHIASDGVTVMGSEQTSFNTALRTVGTPPQASTVDYFQTSNSTRVAGASFESSNRMIRYHLKGLSQPCTAGGTGPFSYDTFTQCRIVLQP